MFLLQIDTITKAVADTTAQVTTATAPKELRFIDLLFSGGWVMVPLLLLFFLALVIFIERYLTIRKASKDETNLMQQVKESITAGKLDSALAICRSSNTALGRMLQKGLLRIGRPIKDIEGAIENIGKLEVSKLEKNISILGIVAGIAPMLGFVGTISGVIRIFYNISLTDNISMGTIAGGLYEKMITSASGLIIGILAYVAYHVLNIMVDRVILKMETDAVEFIDLLEEPIIHNPDKSIKTNIHHLKKELLVSRKSISPLREAISRFSKSESKYINDESKLFIRDLYDHTVQVLDMVESYRDTINGLQDLYLSEISFKMNQVMQILTIISVIFVPLTFLAGIYGMNFDVLPELHWKYGYMYFWIFSVYRI